MVPNKITINNGQLKGAMEQGKQLIWKLIGICLVNMIEVANQTNISQTHIAKHYELLIVTT